MSFESNLILCQLAINQKLLTEKEFYECLSLYRKKETEASLIDIAVEKDFISKAYLESLQKSKIDQNYNSLVEGYQILDVLGQGGMGCVYRAIQTSMEREVALKILPNALSKDQEFIARFLKEAKLTGRLNHINLITGYDVGESRGIYFFAMELVNGITLDQFLKDNKGPLYEEKAIDFILQVAKALECAYEFKIIHRDIKPDNILITPKGVAKLADMGLAKIAVSTKSEKKTTERGVIVGTPWYLAPEQAKGEDEIDCRADIYSLGITLFQLLTNEVPFDGDSVAVVMTKHIVDELPLIEEKNPQVSSALCRIVEKMAAKDRENRYQTPTKLIEALEKYKAPPASASATASAILQLDVLAEPPRYSLPPRSSTIEKNRFHFCFIPSEEDIWFAKIALKNKVLTIHQLKKAFDYQEQQSELGLTDDLSYFLQDQEMISFKQKKIMNEVLTKILWKELQGGIERLILKYKLVTPDILKKIQAHLEQNQNLSLLDFLLRKNLITPSQKKQLSFENEKLNNAKVDSFLTKALVDCKLCKYEKVQEALKTQRELFESQQVKSIGQILIDNGDLYQDQYQALMRAFRRKDVTQQPITELLNEKRKLTVDEVSTTTQLKEKPLKKKETTSSGLFDMIDSAKFASSADDLCPYCDAELIYGATTCRECGKRV